MSRRIENHEILERGLGELDLLKKVLKIQEKELHHVKPDKIFY